MREGVRYMCRKYFSPRLRFAGYFIPKFIADKDNQILSMGAKVCYAWLQFKSHEGDEHVSFQVAEIVPAIGVGERQVRNYLQELVEQDLLDHIETAPGLYITYKFVHHEEFDDYLTAKYSKPKVSGSVNDSSNNRTSGVNDSSNNRTSGVNDRSNNRTSGVIDRSNNRTSGVNDRSNNRTPVGTIVPSGVNDRSNEGGEDIVLPTTVKNKTEQKNNTEQFGSISDFVEEVSGKVKTMAAAPPPEVVENPTQDDYDDSVDLDLGGQLEVFFKNACRNHGGFKCENLLASANRRMLENATEQQDEYGERLYRVGFICFLEKMLDSGKKQDVKMPVKMYMAHPDYNFPDTAPTPRRATPAPAPTASFRPPPVQ